MGVYERLGVRPIMNVAGTITRFGGALMEQESPDAMNEAAKESVRLDELQAAASKIIAEITHAEAGIVTAGAAAALTLGTAACLTGLNVARMNRLPNTIGMPNEVIMAQHQISGYAHSIRAAGATIVEVGIPNDITSPGEVHIATVYDFESAITENTVAIAYACIPGSNPPLEQIIDIGKKYHIPVTLDAANEVPPVENLHKFIDMGADLVAFSGGKGIRGPQASGILCGRRDLVAAAALQNWDMGEPFDEWNPPPSLIPKERLCGVPQHGIGRSMKITKEAIIGLLIALQVLSEEGFAKRAEQLRVLLGSIQAKLEGIAGLELEVVEECEGGYPMLKVKVNKKVIGRSAAEVCKRLEDDGIYVWKKYLGRSIILVHSINMDEEMAKIVGERLYIAITRTS